MRRLNLGCSRFPRQTCPALPHSSTHTNSPQRQRDTTTIHWQESFAAIGNSKTGCEDLKTLFVAFRARKTLECRSTAKVIAATLMIGILTPQQVPNCVSFLENPLLTRETSNTLRPYLHGIASATACTREIRLSWMPSVALSPARPPTSREDLGGRTRTTYEYAKHCRACSLASVASRHWPMWIPRMGSGNHTQT